MNDLFVCDGRCFDGVLDEAGETVADGFGGSAVEAEDVFIEVVLQVFGADSAVMGAEQPSFGEAEDEVDGGQVLAGVAGSGAEFDDVVGVAFGFEAAVAAPAIGGDGEWSGGVGIKEVFEIGRTGRGDEFEAQPAEGAMPALSRMDFNGTGDQALAGCGASRRAGFPCSDKGFVGLDVAFERLTPRPDHRPADLVQPAPSMVRRPLIRFPKGTRPAGRGGAVS